MALKLGGEKKTQKKCIIIYIHIYNRTNILKIFLCFSSIPEGISLFCLTKQESVK